MLPKKDGRFDELHKSFWSYLGFWVYQMMWVYATCSPIVFVNGDEADPAINAVDWIGWSMLGTQLDLSCKVKSSDFQSSFSARTHRTREKFVKSAFGSTQDIQIILEK